MKIMKSRKLTISEPKDEKEKIWNEISNCNKAQKGMGNGNKKIAWGIVSQNTQKCQFQKLRHLCNLNWRNVEGKQQPNVAYMIWNQRYKQIII